MGRTVVVKVGTSSLTDSQNRIDRRYLAQLTAQLAGLMEEGHRLVLVTSGAVRAGAESLGWRTRPRSMAMRQAAAAVGQSRLMALYGVELEQRGKVAAQILLTRQLAQDRTTYVNAQNTLTTLLNQPNVLPIVNENDTVAVEEIRFGDNDTLAALVAALVQADLLVLLTNVDGLLGADGTVIPVVDRLDESHRALAGGASGHGSGGMITKLLAAEIAAAAGVETVIARGRRPEILRELVQGVHLGTRFPCSGSRLKGRKHWLTYGTQPVGTLVVNDRARQALLHRHGSLLPVGLVRAEGSFPAGAAVRIAGEDGTEVARGVVTVSSSEAARLVGVQTDAIAAVLGRPGVAELVHRDNLVVLH